MKFYFAQHTAWAGNLIGDIVWMCGEHYHPEDERFASHHSNFRSALVMAAEGILTKNGNRNYRYTIETYFHSIAKATPSPDDKFWNWGQFVLKGRIPFGGSGYYTVQLTAEKVAVDRCLVLEVNCYGSWNEARRQNFKVQTASKIKTWKQDILVKWLARWNWEVLRLPVADEGRILCLGEFLASELYHNCGDEAGRNATLDACEDRGTRWLLS